MIGFLARLFSRLFFLQFSHVVSKGKNQFLKLEDLPELPEDLSPENIKPEFLNYVPTTPLGLLKTCALGLKKEALTMCVLITGVACFQLLSPRILFELVQSFKSDSFNVAHTSFIAFLMMSANLAAALCLQHYFFFAIRGVQIAVNGINHRVYEKTLRLSLEARARRPIGDIVNHIGLDSDVVANCTWVSIEITYTIVLLVGASIMLYGFLGTAAYAVYAVLLCLAPISFLLGRQFLAFDDSIMKKRDERVSLISQFVSSIRIVKFFAWEASAISDVNDVRSEELKTRKKMILVESLSFLLYLATTTVLSSVGFSVYLYQGHSLDAATIFSCIALFTLLEGPFGHLTELIAQIASAKVSAGRLDSFFKETEKSHSTEELTEPLQPVGVSLDGVKVNLGNFHAYFDLLIQPGESVAIVGPVGSGKTTLLHLILGEVLPQSGSIHFKAPEKRKVRMALVPQQAFVLNNTFKQNVLLGEDDRIFAESLRLSMLQHDLKHFNLGSETEIGEQGINLSGGQKQRLSLARAYCYKPGLLLLDDPFSAVDEGTEEQLVSGLLFGAWAKLTRVVVTHRLASLGHFDRIVFIKEGKIQALGSLNNLLKNSPVFCEFYKDLNTKKNEDFVEDLTNKELKSSSVLQFTVDEDRVWGKLSAGTLKSYLGLLGGKNKTRTLLTLLFMTLFVGVFPAIQNALITVWSDHEKNQWVVWFFSYFGIDTTSSRHFLLVYLASGLVILAAFFIQHYLWARRSVDAAKTLHEDAYGALMRTKTRFFDTNPAGRILNRFSQDVDSVERQLPWAFEQALRSGIKVLVAFGVLALIVPMSLPFILLTLYLYNKLQKDYRESGRESKRMSSITKSPKFAHFKETIEGLSVIRAFQKQDVFFQKFVAIQKEWQRATYGSTGLNRWFSVRAPLYSSVLGFCVALCLIGLRTYDQIFPGQAALVLVYCVNLWGALNWTVRAFSEAESRLISVERLKVYTALEPETQKLKDISIPQTWPQKGTLEFRDVHARYDDHLPLVLHGLSFLHEGGKTLGIVGRTGSGKSTILSVLYRLIQPSHGRILIDGVDISGVDLGTLRRSIAIIPQDPIVFAGSLRSNLDRFENFSDSEIWNCLDIVSLKTQVQKMGGLETRVQENGMNLSLGQRQLLCLARAILYDCPIVVMDEATANVDVQTDEWVHNTIQRVCQGKTLMIIAHRLQTLSLCDQILSLENGRLKTIYSSFEDFRASQGVGEEAGLAYPALQSAV